MKKSESSLGLGGLYKEWLEEQVKALAKSAKLSEQNALKFISQDDDDNIMKPAAKTSGYLSPSAYRTSKNTPWDLEEYEDLDTFKPWTPEQSTPKYCAHEWVKYVGLNEAFEYCKKCDEKRK
jgi:hypothetical protein